MTQQHVVEDLVDVNWGENEPAPLLTVAPIGSQQAPTAEAIKMLVDAGVINPDTTLETFMRDAYGLPVKAADVPAPHTEEKP